MIDANKLILQAITQAEQIKPAGGESLLAIAMRAVDPDAKATLSRISEVLGLHPSVVVAITMTADVAGNTEARRELGLALFERLKLSTHPPRLTERGRMALASWCVEHLLPMKEVLDGDLVEEALGAARRTIESGSSPQRGPVMELQERAHALQRTEVVGVAGGKEGSKEKLGVSDDQRFQSHAGQAIRALLQGLLEEGKNPNISTTVAGEIARGLEAGLGIAAAAAFSLGLAHHLAEELPPEHLLPRGPQS